MNIQTKAGYLYQMRPNQLGNRLGKSDTWFKLSA